MADLEINKYTPALPQRREITELEQLSGVISWIDDELRAIFHDLQGTGEGYSVSHSPPIRLRVGMVRYADGTNWNPDGVNGEGLYVYKSTGWTFLG